MFSTTLCYIEYNDHYLMLHRVKKEHDVNEGKWIGVGGKFLEGETPEDCLLREVREETGLELLSQQFRGIIRFDQTGYETEYMFLYTADAFRTADGMTYGAETADADRTADASLTVQPAGLPVPPICSEGILKWVPKSEIGTLDLWEGDRVFLRLLAEDAPIFSLQLRYEGDTLKEVVLDGRDILTGWQEGTVH